MTGGSADRPISRRLTVSAILLVALSVVIGIAVIYPPFRHLDNHATHEFQELGTSSEERAMLAMSSMGKEVVLFVFAICCSAAMLLKRQSRTACFMLATLLSLPLASYLKDVWDRSRPSSMDVQVLMASKTYSFPSGHVLGSTAVYGFLAYLIWKRIRKSMGRSAIVGTLLALPFAIGLSRIYLGVHWLTDVLAGLVFGALFVVVLVAIYNVHPEDAPL